MAALHRIDGAHVGKEQGRTSLAYKLRAQAFAVIDYKAALWGAGLPYLAERYVFCAVY